MRPTGRGRVDHRGLSTAVMKALLSDAPGGPETLELREVPDPAPGPGELLVRVRAAAINYPDVLIIEDKYQLKPPRPFAPGGEIAGEVEAVGEGVEGWTVGRPADRRRRASAGWPRRSSFRRASAFRAAAGAQLRGRRGAAADLCDRDPRACRPRAARGRADLARARRRRRRRPRRGRARQGAWRAGDRGGLVGGESRGGARGGRRRGDRLSAGPFDRDGQKALAQLFKDAVGPAGADVIFDPVGGDYAEPALRSIAWEGRYLVVGFPAGIPKLPLNLTLLKSCDVCGVFWGAFAARDPKANAAHVEQLFRCGTRARSRRRSARPIRSSAAARRSPRWRERKAIGKLVVTLD